MKQPQDGGTKQINQKLLTFCIYRYHVLQEVLAQMVSFPLQDIQQILNIFAKFS